MRQSLAGIRRGDGTIWQQRFIEHRIRNDVDMLRHLDYIHFNPVKHGYASHAHAWPYSTFGRYVQAGVYARDWGGGPVLERWDFE